MSALMQLPDPCSRVVIHAAHQFTVVNPWSTTLSWIMACPGWAPVAEATSNDTRPVVSP